MTSFSWIWRFQHLKILGKLYSSHVLCPNVAIFLKNVFIFKDRTLKKNNIERTRISMWFGRENDENVVRTRDWCGWPSSPHSIRLAGETMLTRSEFRLNLLLLKGQRCVYSPFNPKMIKDHLTEGNKIPEHSRGFTLPPSTHF